MRFDTNAYEKLFPRETPKEIIETPVETFTPTKDITEQTKVVEEKNVETDNITEGGADDGNVGTDNNDN